MLLKLTDADIQKIYGFLPEDNNEDIIRILELLMQPGAVVAPDAEMMKKADKLVEGVPCH